MRPAFHARRASNSSSTRCDAVSCANTGAMGNASAIAREGFAQVATARAPQAGRTAGPAPPALAQVEQIALREMASIKEIEVKDLAVEVEGLNADGREVRLLIDRRDGFVLSRKVKTPKYLPSGNSPRSGPIRGRP